MSLQNLTRFPRLELIGAPTPLEYLPRLSDHLGREIFIKRDDDAAGDGETNCASWSFSPPMRCAKGRIL
jgi:tryptophan synthase beta subunit